MIRVLVVAAVLLLLAALLYRLLRPVIKVIQQFLATVRHVQHVTSKPGAQNNAAEKLVQCENCQTWVPQSRAFSANAHEYCSQGCLKRGVVNQRRKKTG